MSHKIALVLLGLVITAFISACQHEPDLSNLPTISFASDIQPILAAKCNMPACHGSGSQSEFPLVTYNDVMDKIESGNPSKSDLYEAIVTLGGDKRMPPLPDSRLSDQQVNKVLIWIEQGAQNN